MIVRAETDSHTNQTHCSAHYCDTTTSIHSAIIVHIYFTLFSTYQTMQHTQCITITQYTPKPLSYRGLYKL